MSFNSKYKGAEVEILLDQVASGYIGGIDLSMMDVHGIMSSSRNTANCYVIKEAGLYKLPLVYGNAIKNGAINSAAYTKVTGDYSHDFVNYNDVLISSPYIEEDTDTLAHTAELSVVDTPDVFDDPHIINGSPCRYLSFYIKSIPETGANAVISILDSDGVVMWSWHIWAWPDDLTPVTITNATGVNYNILPVNLASKKSTTVGKFYNWYYQWGRFTPLLSASDYNSTTNATNYGVKAFDLSTARATTYGMAIRNPHKFYVYSGNSTGNWLGSASYYNLWDANCVSTGNSDNDVVKTVYDPCPPGFKVPNGNTFTYLKITNVVGNFDNGWWFKRNSGDTVGIYFPAVGFRLTSSAALFYVGEYGYIWLSSSKDQNYAYNLYYRGVGGNPQNTVARSSGYSIRPVQE